MKKILIIMMLAVLPAMMANAGGFDAVFNEFKDVENAEYVSIPKSLMKLGVATSGVSKDVPIAKKATGMKVLNIPAADTSLIERFDKSIAAASAPDNVEEILRATSDGEKCKIYFERDGDKIKGVYILAIEPSEVSLIGITGKFTQEDIAQLIADNQ